ncbi:NCS2 family nucleobase:cation symporter [Coriobacteriia bacterium Es71-Z0120]|uniref:solute carrier family 23 protein n=1 Tax=Parvivirga hydrogeniphila TaxID=2939460 RepID=UPI002260CCF2|nr:solute carrier family 23 protein [Parvivirga hydrogeniphila]MCL4079641.1 NCS2 family nucleobase:cation symporter [Parvivirga hydrogeniphila]
MAEKTRVIQTDEKLPLAQAIPLSVQHLMAMFGATVLVPYLTGLHPGIGLMTSGIGTIVYLICVRNKIPSYLGSSFAFIAPLIAVGGGPGGKNIPAALGGLVAAGVVYMVVAGIIKYFGTDWLNKVLPPAVVGAVVIVIGLGLSAVAVKMAMFPGADPSKGVDLKGLAVAAITLFAAIAFSSYLKGFARTIPVLLGIIVGYVVSIPLGMVDFSGVAQAKWIDWPWQYFTYPKFDLNAILIIAPVALVVVVEHIGHLLVINEITGKDFTPMLPESLFGDGLATALSGAVGGTPSTTYAENIGVMAVTKVYATQVFWYAGALAFIIGGFVPKISALISSIPTNVMGGVSLLLFGLIASSGLRLLVDSGIDYSHSRNLILSSVVLVVGIGMETGGFTIPLGRYTVPGMALATLLGVVLNLILPPEPEGAAIDAPDFTAEVQSDAAREA